MFDLKELGLLEQPHTSSGSMPSEKAYRLYEQTYAEIQPYSRRSRVHITAFSTKIDDVEDVIKQTALVLSQLTSYMSMVISPQLYEAELRQIQ